jgi:transcriptional regulator with XRE-family HTH domain
MTGLIGLFGFLIFIFFGVFILPNPSGHNIAISFIQKRYDLLNAVRRRENRHEITTNEIIKVLDVAQDTYERYMKGKKKPSQKVFERWRQFLGCTPGQLSGDDLTPDELEHKEHGKCRVDALGDISLAQRAVFVRNWFKTDTSSNMAQYRLVVDGHEILTTMFTRPEWCYPLLTGIGSIPPQSLQTKFIAHADLHLPQDLSDAAQSVKEIIIDSANVYDRPTYRLTENHFPSTVAWDSINFFDYRFTTGLLADELDDHFLRQKGREELCYWPKSKFQFRKHLLPDLGSLDNLSARHCSGGLGCLVAIEQPPVNKQGFLSYLAVRGGKVTDGRGTLALIPKAFHQPNALGDKNRPHGCGVDNPYWTVFRELHEELFKERKIGDEEQPEEEDKQAMKQKIDSCLHESATMKWFIDPDHPERQKQWQMRLNCFGYNGVSGNFDFGLSLAVHDGGKFFTNSHGTNWETGKLWSFPLTDLDCVKEFLLKPNWAGESLFQFVEGLMHLQQEFPHLVNLPEIKRFVGNHELE